MRFVINCVYQKAVGELTYSADRLRKVAGNCKVFPRQCTEGDGDTANVGEADGRSARA